MDGSDCIGSACGHSTKKQPNQIKISHLPSDYFQLNCSELGNTLINPKGVDAPRACRIRSYSASNNCLVVPIIQPHSAVLVS